MLGGPGGGLGREGGGRQTCRQAGRTPSLAGNQCVLPWASLLFNRRCWEVSLATLRGARVARENEGAHHEGVTYEGKKREEERNRQREREGGWGKTDKTGSGGVMDEGKGKITRKMEGGEKREVNVREEEPKEE
ncbi:hypothetical protein Pcinc_018243 [Petrolisthes cinctipes]|uniref:Uncharacterized protein n=1 Tax=Petrolisthes cinctipes TaxID=88211 RepID=A0AAE1KMZ1_PETCI|nr:hypothetical protein Pcinc_018243 [Petrolisthes cinctipes]